MSMKANAKVIIIGTGFGGLAAAIRMKQEEDDDFIVLERADDVGGVWRDNRYPGCACDVQSHLYSFSFAPNPNWSHEFSRQDEIWAYLRRCAREYGVLEHVRFKTNVQRLDWSEERGEWTVSTNRGEYRGRHVFVGTGLLSDPQIPHLNGLENFKGNVFHSGNWPKDLKLEGKSVAVVGTGASAIQFIPQIQPAVAKLHVFQRTPPWVIKRHDFAIGESAQKRYARMPWLQKLKRYKIYWEREWMAFAFRNPVVMRLVQRQAVRHIHNAVKDSELRRKLTPNYTFGCKRILISNDYYPAMAQPNVNVITSGPQRVTEHGIVGHDGIERRVDMIIFGTGFQVQDLPFSHYIYGRSNASLAEAWRGSPTALTGATVNGFPNLFLLQGPNTTLGHSSAVYMLEAQVEHALRLMKHAERSGPAIVEARADAQERYVRWVDAKLQGTVWTTGGCTSWYMDKTGRASSLWPTYTFTFRNRVVNLRPEEYDFRRPLKSTTA